MCCPAQCACHSGHLAHDALVRVIWHRFRSPRLVAAFCHLALRSGVGPSSPPWSRTPGGIAAPLSCPEALG
eukprot:4751731-Amphidinium_carterae.1